MRVGHAQNREAQIKRQKADDRAGRRRHAGEEMRMPGGLFLLVFGHDIEARQTQRAGNREDKRGEPAEAFDLMQIPEIENERGRDAEIDEIGKRIEFRPEARGAAQRARQTPVEPIENGGDDDGKHRNLKLAFRGKANAGQAHRQREERDHIRQNDLKRNGAEAPAPDHAEIARGLVVRGDTQRPLRAAKSLFVKSPRHVKKPLPFAHLSSI